MAMGENSSTICCRCRLFHQSIQDRDQSFLCTNPYQGPCLVPSCLPCSRILLFPSQAPGFLLACSPPTFSYPESPVPCRRSELNHTNWPLTDPHRSCLSSWINITTWRPQSHRLEVSEGRSLLSICIESVYLGQRSGIFQVLLTPHCIGFILYSYTLPSAHLFFGGGGNISHCAALCCHLF